MDFETVFHLNAEDLVKESPLSDEFDEVVRAIESISEEEIISVQENMYPKRKSISRSIHFLLNDRLTPIGWRDNVPIFRPKELSGKRYRMDLVKEDICIKVAFTNDGFTAWNLLKPTLASQSNQTEKMFDARLGLVIMATEEMKRAGGFDGTVCTMEGAGKYLSIMQKQLNSPLILIGLKAPEKFIVNHTGKPKRATILRI